MDKLKATNILILCLLIIIFLSSIVRNEEKEEHHNMEVHEIKKTTSLPVSDMVIKTMLSLPTITSPVSISSSYWIKVKTLFNQVQTYLFPPNLDFRVRGQAEANEGGGTGEVVKEAVVKSLGKSKATVEDSAKSAANKVKKSLSHESGPHKSAEL